MNTVGYGDIRPYNYIEEIFAIFAMVLASAVFGYVMNSISSIFMNSIELNNKYNAQILVINRFM